MNDTNGSERPVTVGDSAPDFTLADQRGEMIELSRFRGRTVILYFYPRDHTVVCTTQACEFRDNLAGYREAGVMILGVSADDVQSHRKFADKHSLPFTLLADPSKQTIGDYGVLKSYIGGMQLARRDTFVIDPTGRIVRRYEDVEPKGHAQQVLKDVVELQKQTIPKAPH